MTKRFQTPPASLSRTAFVARFSGVFEHSDWIMEAAYDQGLGEREATVEGLALCLQRIVEEAEEPRKRALLCAHPELAGKRATSKTLTHRSQEEQANAGLDHCSAEEFERFQALNAAYQERFGFPFIIAVKGLSRRQILHAFEARLTHSPEVEFAEALAQVFKIALFRLEALAA